MARTGEANTKKGPSCIALVFVPALCLCAACSLVVFWQARYVSPSEVQVDAFYVEALLLTDRPVHMRENLQAGKDFNYTGAVPDGQVCQVLDVAYHEYWRYYKLNCDGVIGWLAFDNVRALR